MMTFFMTPGSCSTGIHILLEELELVFSAHVLNLPAGDQHKPEYLAINPKGSIPALQLDSGDVLTEFQSIAWWLGLSYPKAGLLPDTPLLQAQALDLLSYAVGTVHLQGFTRIFTPERYMRQESDREAVLAEGRVLVKKGLRYLANRLESTQGEYCFERFGVADVALFYLEFWADRISLGMPEACQRHFQVMCQRRAVKQVLAEEGYRIA
jgi:glutathione S-transferase